MANYGTQDLEIHTRKETRSSRIDLPVEALDVLSKGDLNGQSEGRGKLRVRSPDIADDQRGRVGIVGRSERVGDSNSLRGNTRDLSDSVVRRHDLGPVGHDEARATSGEAGSFVGGDRSSSCVGARIETDDSVIGGATREI